MRARAQDFGLPLKSYPSRPSSAPSPLWRAAPCPGLVDRVGSPCKRCPAVRSSSPIRRPILKQDRDPARDARDLVLHLSVSRCFCRVMPGTHICMSFDGNSTVRTCTSRGASLRRDAVTRGAGSASAAWILSHRRSWIFLTYPLEPATRPGVTAAQMLVKQADRIGELSPEV